MGMLLRNMCEKGLSVCIFNLRMVFFNVFFVDFNLECFIESCEEKKIINDY